MRRMIETIYCVCCNKDKGMMTGTLDDSGRVERTHPLLAKVFAFLREHDLAALPLGRTDIDGDRAYVTVEEVTGRSAEEAAYERHDCHTDIQLPITGEEGYGWKPGRDLRDEAAPYDRRRDIVFYRERVDRVFRLRPGEFAVFFPEDGHAPCIDCGTLRKAVVKVLIG